MRRLRLIVEYDGTDFCGWQRQESGPSIQSELEAAIDKITGEKNIVRGAGRTDSGVHAFGQVAHVDTARSVPTRGFHLGLNTNLPRSICVRSVEEVAPAFDARRWALGKLYRYTIWNDLARSSLRDRYAWHVRRALDETAMQRAAQHLVGRHDFNAFRAADCERETTVRTLRRVDVQRDGKQVVIEVEGDAFLKNMVRIISGTLVYVGDGRIAAEAIPSILEGRDRSRAGITAPAKGLCLVQVHYDEQRARKPEPVSKLEDEPGTARPEPSTAKNQSGASQPSLSDISSVSHPPAFAARPIPRP